MIRFLIRGTVREAESGAGLSGLFVKAYDKDLLFDDLLGTASTGAGGAFDIVTESADFRDFFERRPDIYLKIYAPDRDTLLFDTKDAIRWNAGTYEEFDVRIPRDSLGNFAPPRGIVLPGDDDEPRTTFQTGDSLVLNVRGLRPVTPHRVTVSDDDGPLFVDTLITNAAGEIEPTVVWPLLGIEDPRSTGPVRLEDALARWRGRRIQLALADGDARVGEATLNVEQELTRPVVVATDGAGFVRHGFEVGDGAAQIALHAMPRWEMVRVFMVPRQRDWNPGDAIRPVVLEGGRLAIADAALQGETTIVTVAEANELRPGAYDFIVRRLRYGYEDDDDLVVRRDDVIGGRRVTGLVVREHFMESKVIRGGCANVLPIAGRYLGIWPYMNYTNVFQTGENVYGALDPAALDPAHTGKMVAFYIVPHKTAAQWTMDSGLDHLPVLGGNAGVQRLLTQSWCTNANLRLLWPNATQTGEYDVVADFGNDTADPMAFVPDDSFDMPADIIDGYINAGFRIVPDPATDTSFPHAGSFTYNEADEGSLAVNDDDFGNAWSVPLRAKVFFPADVAGATTVAQVSMAQPNYPLVVVVHGNSGVVDSYLGYDYLLSHLARNGFIAASVHCNVGMFITGRARVLRRHLEILFARFGVRAANNVGIMGHSRGGEAVMTGEKLNHDEAWGYNINSVISLAPTDWISDSLAGPWTPPVHVMYGSLDGDVAGIQNTGFELYDRAAGMKKSMSFIYGACHDRFNTVWGDADFFFGKLGPMDIARVLSPAAHQAIATGYMTAFFRQTLRSETQWDGIFKGEWIPAAASASTPNLRIYTQYEDTTVRTVDDFEGAHNATSWATSTIGDSVSQTGLPADPQENNLVTLDPKSPHSTAGIRLRWDSAADVLQWNIPAAQQNVAAFTALSFRITQVADSAHNPANQAQDLRVTLTDATNTARAIRVSKFAEVPYPDVREMNVYTKSALRTIRIPLSAWTIRCLGIPEVNLATVTNVKFEFAEKPAGEVAIDSIQFTN